MSSPMTWGAWCRRSKHQLSILTLGALDSSAPVKETQIIARATPMPGGATMKMLRRMDFISRRAQIRSRKRFAKTFFEASASSVWTTGSTNPLKWTTR